MVKCSLSVGMSVVESMSLNERGGTLIEVGGEIKRAKSRGEVKGRVTEKEQNQRRERRRRIAILAHSIAEQAVSIENTTYLEAIQILEDAKIVVEKSMKNQRAAVPSEIRDEWGIIIEMSEAEAPDKN